MKTKIKTTKKQRHEIYKNMLETFCSSPNRAWYNTKGLFTKQKQISPYMCDHLADHLNTLPNKALNSCPEMQMFIPISKKDMWHPLLGAWYERGDYFTRSIVLAFCCELSKTSKRKKK